MKTLTSGRRLSTWGSYTLLAVVAIAMVVPFLWMITTSLKGAHEVYRVPPTLVPSELHWENFTHVLDTVPFGRFYLNTIIVTTIITASQVATAVLAAYVFARIQFPGRDIIFFLYLATLIVPTQVTMLPLFLMLNALKWVNTYEGLIMPFLANAFIVFFLRQFFSTIPAELEDAARIDGCGRTRFIWQVLLPLSRPALASIGLFTFLGQWNSYIWPLIITNSTKMRTLPIGLRYFVEESGAQYNLMMAAAIITVAPVVLLFFVAQRQFIETLARTGVKS